MSSTHHPERYPTTIDLTEDDDNPPLITLPTTQPRRRSTPTDRNLPGRHEQSMIRRAPPFGRNVISPDAEVIDLLTDSDGMEPNGNEDSGAGAPQPNRSRMTDDGSPEIVFVGSRTLGVALQNVAEARAARRLPTPPALRVEGGLQGLSDLIQRSRDLIFGNNTGRDGQGAGSHYHDDILDRIDGLHNRHRPTGPANNPAHEPLFGLPNYVDVALNYEQAGFDIGMDHLGVMGSEAGRSSTPPEILEQEPYKEPVPAGDGFSRNLKEDDIVVCPYCGEELALGEGDVKQQIWIAKQCGHVSLVKASPSEMC